MGSKARNTRRSVTVDNWYIAGEPKSSPVVFNWTDTYTRFGVDDPMWQSKVARLEPASNGMQIEVNTLRYFPGEVQFFYTPTQQTIIDRRCGLTPTKTTGGLALLSAVRQDAKNLAAIGIRKRILEEQQYFSGLTFLGELRETIKMIKHPAHALRASLDTYLNAQLRKKRRLPRKSFKDGLAESWLEYAFGVAPLINDISSIAKASLGQIDERRVKRLSYTGHAASATSGVAIRNAGGYTGSVKFQTDQVRRAAHHFTIGYNVETNAEGPLRSIYELGGFNLQNVIPTAWELLPWSFFIDYFSNIGDVIETSLVSLEDVRWVNSCTVAEYSEYTHSGYISPGTRTRISGSPPSSIATYRWINREPKASIPFGKMRFELPGSNAQFLNIAALAALQFK